MISLKDYGAKGDGRTDDTEAIRRWLTVISGGHGYVPSGVYCYSGSWGIPSCTRIEGAGVGSTFFRSTNVNATISNARLRWTAEVDPTNGGPPHDHDISISNICFEGDPNAAVPPSANLMTFIGVDDLLMRDVRVQHRRSDAIVLHNCRDGTLDHLQFRDCGKFDHDGGLGQYVGGSVVFAWGGVERLRIINCDAREVAGGYWLQDIPETIALGNRTGETREFGIVGFGKRSVVAANIHGRVYRVDVSGHNGEIHGEEFIYGLNVHADADGCNVYASNLRNAMLSNNLCMRPGGAAIVLASHGAWAGVGDRPPECVSIADNLCCDDMKRASNAVLVTDQGGGPVSNVVVTDNNTGSAAQWQGKPVQVERKGVTAVHN